MRVLFVNLPWAAVNAPSLAFGILLERVRSQLKQVSADVVDAHLDFVDWAGEKHGLTFDHYRRYALMASGGGCGEWIFSAALHNTEEWRVPEFRSRLARYLPASMVEHCVELHRVVPTFVKEQASRIVDLRPDVVGFQLGTAGLATARAVKELAPQVITVLGGTCCDGEAGVAVHRSFPFLDLVVRGEAEQTFPELLRRLAASAPLTGIPGVCHVAANGQRIANSSAGAPDAMPVAGGPDFDNFFRRFERSRAATWVEPALYVEGARGCWWGAHSQCRFCGLNGCAIGFRHKTPESFYDELVALAGRHRVLDMFAVDRILAHSHLRRLMPQLAAANLDLRLQYAVRPRLTARSIRVLADSGVVEAQVGIENLSDRVLDLMQKKVSSCENIRFLRDAETHTLHARWNYLYGFPGERDEDYLAVIRQIPALHHLPPPNYCGSIYLDRSSPYAEDPSLGFTDLRPAEYYGIVYDQPAAVVRSMAVSFGVSPLGLGADAAAALHAAVAKWRGQHATSYLVHHDLGAAVLLVNRRRGFDWSTLLLTDPVDLAVFHALERPSTCDNLAARLSIQRRHIETTIRKWVDLGIAFTEGGRYVHIAPRAANQDLIRLGVDRTTAPVRRSVHLPPPLPHRQAKAAGRVGQEQITVHLFRDHDPVALAAHAAMDLGTERIGSSGRSRVAVWYRRGVRMVEIPGVVDLTARDDPSAVQRLALLRELTGFGIAARWRLRLASPGDSDHQLLRHLPPPAQVTVHSVPDRGAELLRHWRQQYRLGLCHYRRGPGFVLVNDWRDGTLKSITIDDPAHLATLDALTATERPEQTGAAEIADLEAERLVMHAAGRPLWLPCRMARWPEWLSHFDR